ncbi:MAG: amino acid ABC transporter permease [Candidatus Bipolaricaulia bacterium]
MQRNKVIGLRLKLKQSSRFYYLWRFIRAAALIVAILWFISYTIQRYYIFHWRELWELLPLFHRGLSLTVVISVISMVFSIGLGLIIALGRLSRFTTLSDLSAVYVHSFRNLPALVVILLFYFGIGTAIRLDRVVIFGLRVREALLWGIIALSFFEAAFIAEIFRGGIRSIHREQTEAARSLGMTYLQAMRYVILPQAFRNIIPPLTGELIALVKQSALLMVIGVEELTLVVRQLISGRGIALEAFTFLALYYLMLTVPLSMFSQYLERRLAVDRG